MRRMAAMAMVMAAGLAVSPAPAQEGHGRDTGRIPPRLLSIPPVDRFYPSDSLRRGEQGLTRLRCRLLVRGTLENCRVSQSSGFAALDAAAATLAGQTRYSPMIVDGAPRDADVMLPVRWVIPGK